MGGVGVGRNYSRTDKRKNLGQEISIQETKNAKKNEFVEILKEKD